MKTLLAFALALTLTVGASAQQIDAGIDVGRAYSIVDGRFVASTVPSLTFLFGPIEATTSTYLNGTRFFEQDSSIKWYQEQGRKRRWSLFLSAANYKWPGGSNTFGQAGIRIRIK
jgi:hypothetical protein